MFGMQPDFQAFLGSFWDMVRSAGHVWEESWLRPGRSMISRQFLGHGHVQDVAWSQPDFLASQCSFWDKVCRPCPGCVKATTGQQPDFQAFWEVSGHGVQGMSGQSVQALFGSHPGRGHVQDVSRPRQGRSLTYRNFWTVSRQGVQSCSGRAQAVSFLAFLGSFWDTVYRPCLGQGRDASSFPGISR
ncbi:Cell division cycle 20.5, cofactor of APC complex [Olea europaea subsp. europaea]|uniref:Cell division cycle 20.5, cofactor of APC complex n=1 Tax=Olea europaea subsp. europaea TaxID=158383 RepID=A0A8S0QFJ6_OLEEU|nr:Cell division cycle 20.5, cofactor of APC complex [Olea europaea subsp. europaea]